MPDLDFFSDYSTQDLRSRDIGRDIGRNTGLNDSRNSSPKAGLESGPDPEPGTGPDFAPGTGSNVQAVTTLAAGTAAAIAGERTAFDRTLTILRNSASPGTGPDITLLFSAPELALPSDIPPEQVEAMVSAMLANASSEIMDISNKLLRLTDAQRKELNRKIEEATINAKKNLEDAQNLTGRVSASNWIKVIAAVIGTGIFFAIACVTTGGVAAVAMGVVFGMALLELVNTAVKAGPTPVTVKGADGKQKELNLSIAGMVEAIVDRIAFNHPTFYKSEQEKQDTIRGWSLGITIGITVTCLLVSAGTGIAAAVKASGESALKVGTLTAIRMTDLFGKGALAGGRAAAGTADIAAGIATIIEGRFRIQIAGLNYDTELARADRRMLLTRLDMASKDFQIYIEAFTQAYKLRDQCLELTTSNYAAADAVRSSIARNFS